MNHSPHEMSLLLTPRSFFFFLPVQERGRQATTSAPRGRALFGNPLNDFSFWVKSRLILLIFFSSAWLPALFIARTQDYAVKIIPREHTLGHKLQLLDVKELGTSRVTRLIWSKDSWQAAGCASRGWSVFIYDDQMVTCSEIPVTGFRCVYFAVISRYSCVEGGLN